MHTSRRAALLLLAAQPLLAAAQNEPIDEIIVDAARETIGEIPVAEQLLLDTAVALKQLPGANVNKNGALTGIAQYRGMFGDRVSVTIDNHAIVTGGPNAMDPPWSYVSPMITEALQVERGIASVSSSPESIGGHVATGLARGSFGGDEFGASGFIGSRYSGNGNLTTTAGRLTLANETHRFSAVGEIDNGQDIDTPRGTVRPSAVDRERYDLSYAFTDGISHVAVHAGRLETTDSGTPALPMDIRFIESDLFGGHFLYAVSDDLSIEGSVSMSDVDHLMDNFALRQAPEPMMFRQNYTTGSGFSYALAGIIDLGESRLRVGSQGIAADHDATITNPNNPAFQLVNFHDVERNLISVFGEWSVDRDSGALELGVSFKHVETDSGEVGASGVMGAGIPVLADAFNQAKRDLDFDDVDAVLKYRLRSGKSLEWTAEAALKSRAPSYQELYLWAPMQATGGLADGRTYVGNLGLQSETSREINLGLESSGDRLWFAPQVFYKRIDDYIQGSPADNPTANMVSMMMSGSPALQFTNIDAKIWGFDVAWRYAMTDRLYLDGVATYVRGRRTDVADNLYRLAPLNGSVGLTWAAPTLTVAAHLVAYADQDNVAAFNGEQTTDGYEIVNIDCSWSPGESLRFEGRIENLFDETYQDHLAGINRARGSDIAVGERVYGLERTITAGVIYSF